MRPSDLAHATAFLTRLPVPARAFGNAPLDFSRQCWAFSAVGALVGAIVASVATGLLALGASPLLAAVFAAATATFVTGALHEDGLADCADGFWGAHEPERRRAIMRDSAIGTYGTMALVAVFAAKVAALDGLLAIGGVSELVAAASVSRAAMVVHWVALPPAPRAADRKGESLATLFGRPAPTQAALAAALALLACLLIPLWATLAGLGAAAVATAAVAALSRAKIGGFTGDTLGATALVCETAFLCGALLPTSVP